ncbi:MAG: hypothetical protein KJ963_02700 [Bacteroidetes bacterium]|nr:hypothetical protein [Bacteroidota bacterium]
MRQLIHILFYKLKSNLKLTVELTPQGLIKNIGSFLLYGVFAIGAFYFTRAALHYLLIEAHLGLFLLHRFLSMALFVFFLTVNLGNIIVSYSTLYRSSEVQSLFTKPVSFTNIFIVKFFDNFFYSSTTSFLIGLAVIAGYGSYFQMPVFFYFIVLFLVFVPFMLISASLAVLFLFGLMKLASRVGIVPVVVSLIVGYISSIYIYFKMVNPYRLINEIMQYYPNIDFYFDKFDPPFLKYLPNHWAAEFLYWTSRGEPAGGLFFLYIIVMVSIITFILLVFVANKYYRKSWVDSLELKFSRKNKMVAAENRFRKNLFRNRQFDVLYKKELLQFIREPGQWLHFLILILFMVIFAVSMTRLEIKSAQPFLQSVAYTVVYLFTAFLIASMAIRFVYPMISMEANNFWKVRSAPVSASKIFWIKLLFVLLPILIIGVLLSLFSNWQFRDEPILIFVSVVSTLFVIVTLVSVNIGGGSFFSTYDEKNPIRIASTQGASLIFLLSLIYLVVITGAVYITTFHYFEQSSLQSAEGLNRYTIRSAVFVGIFSILVSGSALVVGIKSLKRDY